MLGAAASRIRVVGASTPVNLSAEIERLEAVWARGDAGAPRFVYGAGVDHRAAREALDRAAGRLEAEGELGRIYAARARELSVEASICEAAGRAGYWAAARRRYAARDQFDAEADALAGAWLEEPDPLDAAPGPAPPPVRSDDEGAPGSLLCRMREGIGARRLAARVVVLDIAPLAATGDGVIQVASGRFLTREDVERTVLHELDGHAAPSARAAGLRPGIFMIGTARGGDDQEGRALAIERAAGYLVGERRRELALRHVAARSVERGADFVETARLLATRGAQGVRDALRIAARVHRGGGLGREVVYLPALLRVEAALLAQPGLADMLGAGRVSVDAAPALANWARAAI